MGSEAFRCVPEAFKCADVCTNTNAAGIATSDLTSNEIISNDEIKKISFAAGGQQSEYVPTPFEPC